MSRNPRVVKGEEICKKFKSTPVIRTDGKLDQPVYIDGVTKDGALIVWFVGHIDGIFEPQRYKCPIEFTDDQWIAASEAAATKNSTESSAATNE